MWWKKHAKTIAEITFGMMRVFMQFHDWLKILTIYSYTNGLISDLCQDHTRIANG